MADRILGIIMIVISVLLLFSLRGAPAEAYAFPGFFLILLLIFCVILIVKPSAQKLTFHNVKDLGIQTLLIIAYIFALEYVGFVISTLLYLFSTIYLSGYKNYKKNTVVTVLVTAVVFFIFNEFLEVRLP